MPRKPCTRSAVKPAGPVTQASNPLGRSSAIAARTASTVSPTSPEVSIGTNSCTASPSSDGMPGDTSPTPSTSPIAAARSLMLASCSGDSAPSPVTTTTAGIVSPPVKSASRSCTWVASAEEGRKLDWSLVETSSILPK